jgi:hydrogenase 3 maturation protease
MGLTPLVLLGVGNRDLTDDGVGPFVSALLRDPAWLSLDGGTAPERFTSRIRSSGARRVVIVDAVRMGLAPGEVRRVPAERVADVSLGTHDIPISRLMDYLHVSIGAQGILIGIEPRWTGPGGALSPEVEASARVLANRLMDGTWEDIPVLDVPGS